MSGWRTEPLENVCEVLDTLRKPITKRDRVAGEYPYYGATGIVDFVADYIFDEKLVLVGEDGAKWESGEATAFIAEGKYWVNNHAHVLRPKQGALLHEWLAYYLTHLDLTPFVGGLTVPKLNQGNLKLIPISFPSLPEQKRIVEILDEAFDGIAKATANAQRNLANAQELFRSTLSKVFSEAGNADGTARLGDHVTRLTNGYVGPTRNIYLEHGIPYLLARHIKNNRLNFDGKTYISSDFNQKNKKSILKEGDVLLVQSGHIGHAAVVSKEHEGHNCHAMIVITPKNGLLGDYVSLFFQFELLRGAFEEIRSGSTVPHLTCKLVKEILIPLPDISKQQLIIREMQSAQCDLQKTLAAYQSKVLGLQELKQSLLHKAFTGQLTGKEDIAA